MKGHKFTRRVGVWEKERWQRLSCEYHGTTHCTQCVTWYRQSFATSLALFTFPTLLDQISNIFQEKGDKEAPEHFYFRYNGSIANFNR